MQLLATPLQLAVPYQVEQDIPESRHDLRASSLIFEESAGLLDGSVFIDAMACPDGVKERGADLFRSDLVRLPQAAVRHVVAPPEHDLAVVGPPKEIAPCATASLCGAPRPTAHSTRSRIRFPAHFKPAAVATRRATSLMWTGLSTLTTSRIHSSKRRFTTSWSS